MYLRKENRRVNRKRKGKKKKIEGISLLTSHSAGAYNTKKCPGAVA